VRINASTRGDTTELRETSEKTNRGSSHGATGVKWNTIKRTGPRVNRVRWALSRQGGRWANRVRKGNKLLRTTWQRRPQAFLSRSLVYLWAIYFPGVLRLTIRFQNVLVWSTPLLTRVLYFVKPPQWRHQREIGSCRVRRQGKKKRMLFLIREYTLTPKRFAAVNPCGLTATNCPASIPVGFLCQVLEKGDFRGGFSRDDGAMLRRRT